MVAKTPYSGSIEFGPCRYGGSDEPRPTAHGPTAPRPERHTRNAEPRTTYPLATVPSERWFRRASLDRAYRELTFQCNWDRFAADLIFCSACSKARAPARLALLTPAGRSAVSAVRGPTAETSKPAESSLLKRRAGTGSDSAAREANLRAVRRNPRKRLSLSAFYLHTRHCHQVLPRSAAADYISRSDRCGRENRF